MTKSEFNLIRQRSGPLYNDIRLQILLELEETGYVTIQPNGWTNTREGNTFVDKFDGLLTTLEEESS